MDSLVLEKKITESSLAFTHPSTQQQMLMWKSPPKTVLLLKKLGDELMEEAKEVDAQFPFFSTYLFIACHSYMNTYFLFSYLVAKCTLVILKNKVPACKLCMQ